MTPKQTIIVQLADRFVGCFLRKSEIFLLTGIWLVVLLQLNVREQSWLVAKFAALILYVVFGAIALRRSKTMQIRTVAFAAALATYLYIVGVALSKSPASWLA